MTVTDYARRLAAYGPDADPDTLTVWPSSTLDMGRVIRAGRQVWCLPAAWVVTAWGTHP